MISGLIRDVSIEVAGSSLAADAAISATVLYLDDASDFNESGGIVSINAVIYNYSSADLDADTITLASPLAVAAELGFPIHVSPAAMEKRASVLFNGTDDTISVRVPHNLYDRIPEGIRVVGTEESVALEDLGSAGGEWVISDIIGKEPLIDGSYLIPETVPQNVTDGLPPETSPLPVALGTVGVVLLKWEAVSNADPVTYQVHVSTTADFTADATTLLARTVGNFMVVRTLPSGAVLDYGVAYYFRLIAEDSDGAATASEDVSASPVQVTTADVAANYVYAGNIIAEQITGGTITSDLTLASTIKTANTGARVEMSSAGILITDSAGAPTTRLGTDTENFFKGTIEANALTVLGGLTVRGTTNEVSRASTVTLANGVTNSTNAPTAVVDWDKIRLKNIVGDPWSGVGTLKGLSYTPTGTWLAADTIGAVNEWNADGTFVQSISASTIAGLNGATRPASGAATYAIGASGANCYIARLTEETVFADSFSALTGWASSYGTTAIDTSRAKVTTPVNSTSAIKRTLEGVFKTRTVQTKMTPPSGRSSGTDFFFRVQKDSSNSFYFSLRANTLSMYTILGGSQSVESFTFDAVNYPAGPPQYLRIAEINNVVKFSTSPDGVTWTFRRIMTHGLSTATLTGMFCEIGSITPVSGNNLLANGMFETNANDWFITTLYTAMNRDTAIKRTGSWSLRLSSTDNAFAAVAAHSSQFSVVPGVTYNVSAYARGEEADTRNQALVAIEWYSESGLTQIQYDQIDTDTITNAGFTLLNGSIVAPAGAGWARMFIQNNDILGTDSKSWWDDLSFIEASTGTTEIMFVDDFRYYSAIGSVIYGRVNASQTPALGYSSAGNLLVAEFDDANDKYIVRHIDPNDMATAVVATYSSATNAAFTGPLAGIAKGTFDFAEDRYMFARETAGTNWQSFKTSDSTYQSNDDFPVITGGQRGMGYDGTNFWALGSDGNIYKHTNIKWTTESTAWTVGFTWFDGGSQQSGVSPYAAITMKKRARLVVTSPTIPYSGVGDPDRIKVYIGRGGGSNYLQATTAATVNTAPITSVTFSGTVAPTTSTFASATPAKIRNSDDSLVISADGTYKGVSEILSSAVDATTSAGNRPALITGAVAGQHLRIDDDEIISMAGDATQGTLTLNAGAGTILGIGAAIKQVRVGVFNAATVGVSPNNGQAVVTHGGSTSPTHFFVTPILAQMGRVQAIANSATTTVVQVYAFGSATAITTPTVANFYWIAIWV